MIEVNARHCPRQYIDEPDAHESVVSKVERLPGELDLRVSKLGVVFGERDFVNRPIPSLMHIAVIGIEQFDMRRRDCRGLSADFNIRVSRETSALTLCGCKAIHINPKTATTAARRALWTEYDSAESSPATFEIIEVRRRVEAFEKPVLERRGFVRKVAARTRRFLMRQ